MANETLTSVFSDIADAIRAKGVTGQMMPTEMPTKITSIPSGGSGDPRFSVDEQGNLTKLTYNINWFNGLESIGNEGLKQSYINTGVESVSFPNLKTIGDQGLNSTFGNCVNLTQISFPELTTISGKHGMSNCFNGCTSLREASFPKLTTLTSSPWGYSLYNCFRGCTGLTSISFPVLGSASHEDDMANLCEDCTSLISASFPELTTVSGNYSIAGCFDGCTNLKTAYFPKLSKTDGYVCTRDMFNNCTSLELIDFHLATAVPKIESDTFKNTNNTFKIVVPTKLYDQWKSATNWSIYAAQIVMDCMMFKATQANSTIQLTQVGNPSPVSLEYMTTGSWTPYTIGDTITLANVGDEVYFRATSGANNKFGTDASNYHQFVMTGQIEAKYSINRLLNKDGVDSTLDDNSYLFYKLFSGCSALKKAPELPETTMDEACYAYMFQGTSIGEMPKMPVATLAVDCYKGMFQDNTALTTVKLEDTTMANGCYDSMFKGCSSLAEITTTYLGNFSTTYFNNWVDGVASTGTFYYNGSDTTQGVSAIPTGWTVLPIPRPELCFTAREANSTVKMKSSSGPSVSLEYSTDGVTWSPFVVGTTTVTLANVDDKMWVRATSTNKSMASNYNSSYNYFVMTGQIAASGNINSLLNGQDPDAVTTAPQYAYPKLFNGCSALVDAIDLMLPSTQASQNSYGLGMFRNCTNLVGGPTIMATNLLTGQCTAENMFNGCSSLASVKIYATGDTWNSSNTQDWMSGVPSTGTFYYNGTYTGRGSSYIPNGWTITQFTP